MSKKAEYLKYNVTNEGEIVDLMTGEIIDLKEIHKAKEKRLMDEFHEKKHEMYEETGQYSDLQLVRYKSNEYNCKTIKKDYHFGKVFRVAVRDLMERDRPSPYALMAIAVLEPYISFPTNSIIYHSKNPSLKDLEEILDVKKSKLYSILKELEERDVIKRVKINGQTIIYFNPFLYSSGGMVTTETYNLFKDSQYNPKCCI